MNSLARKIDSSQEFEPQVVLPSEHEATVKKWLRGEDPSLVLGHLMYFGDRDAKRWVKGHSSPDYYVKREENEVLEVLLREIKGDYDVLADAGVGGTAATLRALKIGKKLGAKGYVGIDLAFALAMASAEVARREGFVPEALNADIFEKLIELSKKLESLAEKLGKKALKTVIGIFGLTPGNLEYFDTYEELEQRDIGIHKNYVQAVSPNGGLITGWDACLDANKIKPCYDNPEFGELVLTCISRFMDIGGLTYRVETKEMQSANDKARRAVRLSTGLYAENDELLTFAGEDFLIKKGRMLPVVLSYRINVPGKEHIIQESGFRRPRDNQIWNADTSIHYAHCGLN